jgi:hypothetical protein
MSSFLTYSLISIVLVGSGLKGDRTEENKSGEVDIEWLQDLPGDFSFKDNWSYPEGIFKDKSGQLNCDGCCPPEIDGLKNENGKIFKDSLSAFYQLVDTSHQFYSVQSEAWCYEYAGTNFITFIKVDKDSVIGFTKTNASTHSSLHLLINKNKCIPTIELNSVASPKASKIYVSKNGRINIDRELWTRGIMKADFYFTFDQKGRP